MSGAAMLDRVRQSLALRLGLLYALIFAAGAAVVFALLYWVLAGALESRERAAVERKAEDYAQVYEQGGLAALRARIADESGSPELGSLFVRIIGGDGAATFYRVPTDWVQTQAQQIIVPDGWGGWQTQAVRSVRVPRNAEKDFTVANRPLEGGQLLQVARSTDNRAVLLAPLLRNFFTIGAGATLVAAFAGGLLVWRVTRPIREVNATTRRIVATGDLTARVPVPPGGGELADLVRQLNTVLSQNAALIGAMRETLDNLAHDLRTPLARLRGTADFALQGQADPAAAREALADCLEESERVLLLLETLLDVSAAETGVLPLRRAAVDLRTVLAGAASLYREVAEEKNIRVELAAPGPVWVEGDALRLGQAVANLLDNALKYTPAGGWVRLEAGRDAAQGVIRVSDSGAGVPPAEREKIWRRLYRGDTSRSQRGFGLGLSVVKAIVEAHQGTVAVEEVPGGGALFLVRLPRALDPGPAALAPAGGTAG
jgi:signal transduction histidine kinase